MTPTTTTFSELVEGYLAMRRGLGYRLIRQAVYLDSFARYLDGLGAVGPVSLEQATAWATTTTGSDPQTPARRLMVVRGFLRYLAVLDGETEIPPPGFLGPTKHRSSPHVYSDDELQRLLRAAAGLSPSQGLRPHCYVTLFSLLACTGLRISEALALAREDVDLLEGVITVRTGKGGKSRIVPLHASALEPLRAYVTRRDEYGGSDAFFRTERHDRLSYSAVRQTFDGIRRQLGWTATNRTRVPRIHDLRHRMVVQRLLSWHAEGVDVDAKLPALATYVGHVLVSDLYWYFSATPELMGVVAERFAAFGERSLPGAR